MRALLKASLAMNKCLAALSVAAGFCLCNPASAASLEQNAGEQDGFKFGGYSSASLIVPNGGNKELSLDEISLITRWEGNSRFRFFSELEIERPLVWREGQDFSRADNKIDVERFYIDYNLSEKINLRGGRFLTPAGRWNLIHAAPLVWTTLRPLATSRLFPTSVNGAMLYGATPVYNRAFEYSLFMEGLQDQESDRDEIAFKDVKGARFNFTGKTNWGMSVLEFTEDIPGTPKFRMYGLDFMTKHEGWEFSGEAFKRYTTNNGDGGSGGYLQAVAPLAGKWFAVARLENFKRPLDGSSERWVLGTAWRMKPTQVLKMEVVGGDEDQPGSPKGFLASFAILF